MKVLVVEDEVRVGRVLLELLKRWNVEAVLAGSGEEALQYLQTSSADLLLTDLAMPNMSGNELVRRVRQTERHKNLPVLMISGKAHREDILEAGELGVTGFLPKPFRAEDLRRKVFGVYREHRKLVFQQRTKEVWERRTTVYAEATGPQIVFGEPVRSLEELYDTSRHDVATYLARASEAIAQANADNPGLNLGYVIEDDTANLVAHLKKQGTKKIVRLILLSARCRGNPVLIARLFGINRKEDLPVYLVYDHPQDVSPEQQEGLRKLGMLPFARDSLDPPRLRKLIDRHVMGRSGAKPREPEPAALSSEEIHGRILKDLNTMVSLPALPQVCEKIAALDRDPNSDMNDWIKVIRLDPMTCATILRHANSLSFGFKVEVREIDRAVVLLGKDTVAGLVASEAMRQAFTAVEDKGFILEDFWLHNVAVGFASYILSFPLGEGEQSKRQAGNFAALGLTEEAVALLKSTGLPERLSLDTGRLNAFTAGIMHDIGKVTMAHSYPGLFPLVVAELKRNEWGVPMLAAEQETAGGLTHIAVGEILLRKWELGEELALVALHHHRADAENPLAFVVGLADFIGGALFPFPREARYPVGKALEDDSLSAAQSFLPQGFYDQPHLRPEDFLALARAISPRVKHLTQRMRQSLH
jgi:DNA-binding response OmpR family regulator/HD-like signal output (HDOD) protein